MEVKIGLSKGITLNTGNYESARIDYWMERTVPESEKDSTLAEMSKEIDNVLDAEVQELGYKLAGKQQVH